jgi:hypothetical protein
MAVRIYLMPIIGGTGFPDPRRPKYLTTFAGFTWEMLDYGFEPACIVGVHDIDPGTHNTLAANADVSALPADLTQQIGAQLTPVQNAVSALNIPEDWIQSTFTYMQVLRVVVLVFLFMQRFHGTLPNVRIFGGAVTLATQINQLPANVRAALATSATSLGFNTAGLGGTTTLRAALKTMANQFSTIKINAFGSTL